MSNHVLYEPVCTVDAEVKNEDEAIYPSPDYRGLDFYDDAVNRASRLTLCFSLDQLIGLIGGYNNANEASETSPKHVEE